MRVHDLPPILDAFDRSKPILEREHRGLRDLNDLLRPAVERNSHWGVRVLVANYGASPVLLWPSAAMLVKPDSVRAEQEIPAKVAIESSDSSGSTDLDAVHFIPPGERAWIWVKTQEPQGKIPGGDALRGHYEAGSAQVRVRVKLTRRGGVPPTRRKASVRIAFKGQQRVGIEQLAREAHQGSKDVLMVEGSTALPGG